MTLNTCTNLNVFAHASSSQEPMAVVFDFVRWFDGNVLVGADAATRLEKRTFLQDAGFDTPDALRGLELSDMLGHKRAILEGFNADCSTLLIFYVYIFIIIPSCDDVYSHQTNA